MIFNADDFCRISEVIDTVTSSPISLSGGGWLVILSSGRAAVSGDSFAPVMAVAGQLLLAAPNTRVTPAQPAHLVGVRFSGSCAAQLQALTTPFLQSSARLPGVAEALDAIAGAGTATPEEAFSLLCRLERFDEDARPASSLAAQAMAAVREHYASLYGVEELALALGVTKSHLVRSFKAATGTTPGSYLTDIRLQAARGLLSTTDCSLELVAQLCGFSGANYFVRVFRQKIGVTPAAFRASRHLPASRELLRDEMYL